MCVQRKLTKYQEINLSDFALFLSVMRNREAYENVLSIILDEPDLVLAEVKVEQVILNKPGKRAIRLDAWAQDTKNRQFNTEMQNDTDSDDVQKRARFYQGLMDAPVLKSGRKTKYRDLQDETTKIFLNMKSRNGRQELVSLLQYMKDTDIRNPEIVVKDERIMQLDKIVTEVKESEEWEDVHMSIYSQGIERGIARGMEQGLIHGKQESILDLLQDCGSVGEELQKKISNETNMDLLKKWLKLASRVNSIEEFEAQLNN